MSFLKDSRSIKATEAKSLATTLGIYYFDMFGKIVGKYLICFLYPPRRTITYFYPFIPKICRFFPFSGSRYGSSRIWNYLAFDPQLQCLDLDTVYISALHRHMHQNMFILFLTRQVHSVNNCVSLILLHTILFLFWS